MRTIAITCLTAFLASSLPALAAGKKPDLSKLPPAADRKEVTFDREIKPILGMDCVKCHGPEKQKGRLRFDSREATLKGGEHGKVVTPGKSAESKLVHAVARLNEDEAMPPAGKGEPLTPAQVGMIRAWIDQGAK